MPRDGSGHYTYPAGTEGIPDATIESAKYNTYIADVQQDLNTPRPVATGGTGATTPFDACNNIGAVHATGDTMTGNLTIAPNSGYSPTLFLNKSSSGLGSLIAGSTGTPTPLIRWLLTLGNGTPETGGNAGSDFGLHRYADTGVHLGQSLLIDRATGATTINGAVHCNLSATEGIVYLGSDNVHYLYYNNGYSLPAGSLTVGGAVSSTQNFTSTSGNVVLGPAAGAGTVFLRPNGAGDGAGEAKLSYNGNFLVPQVSTDSVQSNTSNLLLGGNGAAVILRPYGITNPAGQAYLDATGTFNTPHVNAGGNVIAASNVNAGGNVIATSNVIAHGAVYVQNDGNPAINFQDSNGTARVGLFYNRAFNTFDMMGPATTSVSIPSNGKVQVSNGIQSKDGFSGGYGTVCYNLNWSSGSGAFYLKADDFGVGFIAITSDYRTKKDIVDLQATWDVVKALRPVKYTQANFGPGTPPLYVADNIERWGFLAHEIQEATTMSAATGHKDIENEVQQPNPWTVIAALTKALQEAMTRIEALESA